MSRSILRKTVCRTVNLVLCAEVGGSCNRATEQIVTDVGSLLVGILSRTFLFDFFVFLFLSSSEINIIDSPFQATAKS